MTEPIIALENIAQKIFEIRGYKVMVDRDLAQLYQVTTGNLNLAVRRNGKRFPPDFMFRLTREEFENLILQTARSSWGGSRHLPYVFTEPGVAMLSSVLKSERAVGMNIYIIRAFIKMRELLASNKDLAAKIEKLERKQDVQGGQLKNLCHLINRLLEEPSKPPYPMGFQP